MSPEEFAGHYPRLYHMAEAGTWDSICRHGLLSTSALLDLFEIRGDERAAIERARRPEIVVVSHRRYGDATIRDQKPMSDLALRRCLKGMSLEHWYRTLNRKVFFWVSEDRLWRLLVARAYRSRKHCVITVDSANMLVRHSDRITLSPINSGSTIYKPQPRGEGTFKSLIEYPFDCWRRRRNVRDAVVELAVDYSVPDIRDFVVRVAHVKGRRVVEQIL